MPVQITANDVTAANVRLPYGDFTRLVHNHLRAYPATPALEGEGAKIMATDFPEKQLPTFVCNVCNWGGYPGIAARVLNQNSLATIRARFRDAAASLGNENPRLQAALLAINSIRQLGSPSFASKHLRFIRPDICPVLDSINSDRLGYHFAPQGFESLSNDCLTIARRLQEYGIINPMKRENGTWFAADVEMALFAYLQNL
jgi:hypothetical protein